MIRKVLSVNVDGKVVWKSVKRFATAPVTLDELRGNAEVEFTFLRNTEGVKTKHVPQTDLTGEKPTETTVKLEEDDDENLIIETTSGN